MLLKQKLCGNCFSRLKGKKCTNCGYTEEYNDSELDVLPVGTVLNERYVIGKMLGKGGFGITYLAYDEKEKRAVAIKEFYPDKTAVRSNDNITVEPMTTFQTDEFSEGLERFFNEAEIIMKFRESSEILGLYEVFRMNGTAYYAMEFFNGISLKYYVSNIGKITESEAVYIAERILPALSVIHSGGILHRDVSPDNIMLCGNGRVMLIDFGSARILSSDSQQNMSVILKEGFAPIEQYQRKSSQGSWTDIYSLAMSLYFGLTGIAPENPIIRLEDDSSFQKGIEGFSAGLAEIIKKASAVNKEDRYQLADDMLSDIQKCGITAEMPDIGDNAETIINKPVLKKNKSGIKKAIITFSVICSVFLALIIAGINLKPSDVEVKIGGEMFSINETELDLQNRELTNAQIANLKHMKKLKYLNISDNYITDLSCLNGLTELESLHFSNNNVSDISFMRSMTHLKKISAENNSISDISVLSDKTELEQVFFGDNYVTDISPLANSRGLVYVGLNEAQIGTIDALTGMPELEMVCLAGCNLKSIEPLRDCDNLRFVYLGRNSLDDVSPLAGCNIEELYLDNNRLSGHTDSFKGITLNGFACMEGNGFSEDEIQNIIDNMNGEFTVYY
ncbi:MAG: leucine-rich repeat domain-containing protein [Oscillospiraceae bacterium]